LGSIPGRALLPVAWTGSWGRATGGALWQVFGVGAIVVPILGIGWALAAFERLGPLSWGRAAVLGAGLVLLIPYGIALAIGPTFAPDYITWTRTERLVGLFPGFLANGVEGAIGTAGAVLAGPFAFSALGTFPGGWHPLQLLRQREAGRVTSDWEKPIPSPKRGTGEAPR